MNKQELRAYLKDKSKVVVYVSASWCGPCKRITPLIESYRDKIEILKLDYDEDQGAVSSLRVRVVPTFMLFRYGNHEQVCFSGNEEEIERFFASTL